MANVLTEKYGPLPGWAWGGIAVVGGLVVFARSRQQAAAGQQAGMPAVSPAASAVPFVPSVTVTGIPPTASAAGTPPTNVAGTPGSASPGQLVQLSTANGVGIDLYSASGQRVAQLPSGTTVSVAGAPRPGGGLPITWLGQTLYVDIVDPGVTVTPVGSGGGRGGYGLAGQAQPAATPMFGWTAGFLPQPMAQRIGGQGGSSATRAPSKGNGGGRGAAPYVHQVLLSGFGGGLQEQGRRLGQGGGRATLHPNRPAGQRSFRLFARR